MAHEVWEAVGLPAAECIRYVDESDTMRQFRGRLFSRIVPTVKAIGLWGPKVRKAYADMGVMDLAELDIDAQLEDDQKVADAFDLADVRRHAESA
jgi:hypothetical protein